MNNFEDYAKYYDLLYHDKDYTKEVDYVESLFKSNLNGDINSILELGCGTGIHTKIFAERNYSIHAIDYSEEMISLAQKRASSKDHLEKIVFHKGDVRNYRTDEKFDAIISLFHVASYQTSEEDFENFIATARSHLKKGGIFIFDFWHKSAVLSEKPNLRIKRVKNKNHQLVRIAEPVIHTKRDVVDVNYEVFISDKKDNSYKSFKEKHPMRYFSCDFIKSKLIDIGFERTYFEEWLTKKVPSNKTWGVVSISFL